LKSQGEALAVKKYTTDVRIIFADTDCMGIVYHTNYIKFFEIGRTEYLREIGYPYAQLDKEGVWLPVASVYCEYKSPARYDDVLTVHTWVKEFKSATVIIAYEIYRKETDELLVRGETKHPITDATLKPIRLRNVNPELYKLLTESL